MSNLIFLQVARYSALGFGIIYGIYHQATLTSSAKLAATKREYEHKQKLIEQAKAEYSKRKLPPSQTMESGGGTFDPNKF
jgi:F-type H+-transporting ATP synthase subunit e